MQRLLRVAKGNQVLPRLQKFVNLTIRHSVTIYFESFLSRTRRALARPRKSLLIGRPFSSGYEYHLLWIWLAKCCQELTRVFKGFQGFQRFPRVSNGFQGFPKVAKVHHKVLISCKHCQHGQEKV